jgi:hypothetical protein
MSHHLDSPRARQDPRLDLTDQYVFRGEAGTVFVMDVNSSLSGPDARPGFHPEGRYEIKIHLDGAELEALAYRVTFGESDEAGEQRVALHLLTGPDARDDAATGELLAQGRTNSPIAGPAGLRLWAGRARDPFYVDLRQVGAMSSAVAHGAKPDPAGWSPQVAQSSLAGSTIHAIVLEVADQDPRLGRGRRIGVWSATKLATDAGGWRQINRAGRPMVWPIFRPDGSAHASEANTTSPARRCAVSESASRGSSRGSSQPMARPPIRRPTVRRSPCACSPTCCPTGPARRRPSGSSSTTGARSPTTPPRRCSPSS